MAQKSGSLCSGHVSGCFWASAPGKIGDPGRPAASPQGRGDSSTGLPGAAPQTSPRRSRPSRGRSARLHAEPRRDRAAGSGGDEGGEDSAPGRPPRMPTRPAHPAHPGSRAAPASGAVAGAPGGDLRARRAGSQRRPGITGGGRSAGPATSGCSPRPPCLGRSRKPHLYGSSRGGPEWLSLGAPGSRFPPANEWEGCSVSDTKDAGRSTRPMPSGRLWPAEGAGPVFICM